MVEPIFERIFVMDELNGVDYYYLNNNHCKSRDVNAAPCHRLDFRMKVWDVFDNLPDEDRDKAMDDHGTYSLEEMLWDDINSNLETYGNDGETPFEVFTDMNGYRLLCDIPVYSTFEQRQDHEDELADVYDRVASQGFKDAEDTEEIQDILNEIRARDEELCRIGLQLKRFNEIAESYLNWDLSDDRVWIKSVDKKVKGEARSPSYKLAFDWEIDDYLYDSYDGEEWIIIDTKHKDYYEAKWLCEFLEMPTKKVEVAEVEVQTVQC